MCALPTSRECSHAIIVFLLLSFGVAAAEQQTRLIAHAGDVWDDPTVLWLSDADEIPHDGDLLNDRVEPAQYQRPILPLPNISTQVGRPSAGESPIASFRTFDKPKISVVSYIRGNESATRRPTDIGNLFQKSPSALGVRAIRRQSIVTDNRIRGSKNTQQLASGSHWVPARMDLDTTLSKIDSRLLEDVIIIRGPYSSIYGPGFDFIDFELRSAPRFDRMQSGGATSLDFHTNGEQWYGRQTVFGGDSDSGFRFGYGHRTGNDYSTGDGRGIPSSYKSRDVEFAYGIDLTDSSRLEFAALRLDQTDVEMPGQAFDIDYLVTDAYELKFLDEANTISDSFELSGWFNRTELAGSAQRPGKRRQFPFYDDLGFVGNTDVDSMSTGYTASWTWETEEASLTAGTDLRYVKQELNEITSGNLGFFFWDARNSPIPRAHQSNPGFFIQRSVELSSVLTLTTGARIDITSSNIDDDATKLNDVAIRRPFDDPLTLGEILGSNDFDRDYFLGSTFVLAQLQPNECWTATLGYGYAERAPTLTELYAAESFMFLLQNGLNTVTGNPELDKERLWQIDAGVSYDNGRMRTGISGFHGWVQDYITFENMRVFQTEQVNLQFVNTQLATLSGGELHAEYDSNPWFTTFGTLSYVEGRDRTRRGDFATQQAEFNSTIPSVGSQQVAGLPRGDFSGVAGADEEPLPNIGPLEARLGLRLHQANESPAWSIELSARVVDNQDRVATSLLESTTPGFTVWDLRSFWRPSDSLLLVAGVENFTDKQYREYLDFRPQSSGALAMYQPGVNFYFGTELTY